jgi:DNA repair exonuclease SbcCD ATPase subunit
MTDNDICKFFVEFDLKFRQLELELRARLNDVWVRVNCVEDRLPFIEEYEKRQIDENRKVSKRINELEELYKSDARNMKQVLSELAKDNKRITKLERHFSGDYQLIASKLNPHKCPVCDGHGNIYSDYLCNQEMLLAGWHRDALRSAYKQCVSCEGKGIVWG